MRGVGGGVVGVLLAAALCQKNTTALLGAVAVVLAVVDAVGVLALDVGRDLVGVVSVRRLVVLNPRRSRVGSPASVVLGNVPGHSTQNEPNRHIRRHPRTMPTIISSGCAALTAASLFRSQNSGSHPDRTCTSPAPHPHHPCTIVGEQW